MRLRSLQSLQIKAKSLRGDTRKRCKHVEISRQRYPASMAIPYDDFPRRRSSLRFNRSIIAASRLPLFNVCTFYFPPMFARTMSSGHFADHQGRDELSPRAQEEIEYRLMITNLLLGDDKHRSYPVEPLTRDLISEAESALLSWANECSAEGFEYAWRLLHRLLEEQQAQNEVTFMPDQRYPYFVRGFLLNRVVDCWRSCWTREMLDMEPSSILASFGNLETVGLTPSNRAFTTVIDAMVKKGDRFEAPLLAQWILDQRIERAEDNPELRPDSFLLNSVIRAWAQSGRLEGPEMAEAILDLMHDLYENEWSDSGPNLSSYAATMDAWSRSGRPEAQVAVDRLMEKMKASTVPGLEPNTFIYSKVIDSWTSSATPRNAHKAWENLQEMIHMYESGHAFVTPQAANFSRVIYAFAKIGDSKRAEKEYDRLLQLYNTTQNPQLKPDDNCKKALIAALSKKGTSDKAQSIMNEIIESTVAGDATMPKRSYFIDLLVAWTKDENPLKAATQSEKLLMKMIDLARSGYPELMPDSLSFLKVAKAWSRVRDRGAERRIESLQSLMEDIYQKTGDPRLQTTGKFPEVLVHTLCQSSEADAPKRAAAVVAKMEEAYAAGNSSMEPRIGIYTNLMHAWIRRENPNHGAVQEIYNKLNILYSQGHAQYRPDAIVYTALMESLALRGDPGKVQAIFESMIDDYNRGNVLAKPDMRAFNMILKAWSFSGHPTADQKAEAAFSRIGEHGNIAGLHLKPDGYSLAYMIRMWCCGEADNAAEKAEFYLRSMVENGFVPSFWLYWDVIRLWLKIGDDNATLRAGALLEDLLSAAHAKKVRAPRAHDYRKFLEAIGNSSIAGRNRQAQKLLKRLPHRKVLPSLMPSTRKN